ncbi:hypothetical protein [Geodermatophilus chilensis]|uniref:hypothetical protein n=1 Tax=Geodermatophilus chilensis TaxID=2035835 RepID=UPI0012FFEF58
MHTRPGSGQGSAVAAVLGDEGVNRRRVVPEHSGDTTDVEHLSELADGGSCRGWIGSASTWRLCSGTRPAPWSRCAGAATPGAWSSPRRRLLLRRGPPGARADVPSWHYTHIHEEVLPYLRQQE